MSSVLVTGGSRGIGNALVRRLTCDGMKVSFTYCRSRDQAVDLERETGAEAIFYDQVSEASVANLAKRIEGSTYDALVNNAGMPFRHQLFTKIDPAEFSQYQFAHVQGVFVLSQALARNLMARKHSGAIVNVLSSYTMGMPPKKLSPYVTAKYALLGLTRSMAAELIKSGIRVNGVSPGVTQTDFLADLPQRFIEQLTETLAMQRLAKTDEVAGVIRFLLSDEAAYVNGVNISVSGGDTC